MINFPFFKYYNPLIINKDLRDYIKKSNTEYCNKYTERNKQINLTSSLLNYRNYSANLLNNKISKEELENEDYLHDFCNINNEDDIYDVDDTKINIKKCLFIVISSLIGGTTVIGFIYFYYKKLMFFIPI